MKIVIIIAFTLLAGCATELTPEAGKIRLTNFMPNGCEYLGEVIGSYSNPFITEASVAMNARNDVRNQAYELGGNTVVIQDSSGSGPTMISGSTTRRTSVTIVGNVYRC